ncbi:phospholipase/carboxylesterase [Amorphus suaedae]
MADLYDTVKVAGDPADPRTLILLHGTGGDARSFAGIARAVAPGAHAISLQGDVLEHGMPRFFRRLREGVYDMDDVARAVTKLAAAGPNAIEAAGRDPAAATYVGFSNGANLIAATLLAHPDKIRRAVLMHPLIPFEISDAVDLAGVDILVTAGRQDPIAPWALTDRLVDGLRRAGADVQLAATPGGHEVGDREIATIRDWLTLPVA